MQTMGNDSSSAKMKLDLRNLSSNAKWWESLFFKIPDSFSDLSFSIGQENEYKNRYCNLWPYNHTLVSLADGSYINASHVRVPEVNRHYICTQMPLEDGSTSVSFWRMVREQGVTVIAMLNTSHRFQYWNNVPGVRVEREEQLSPTHIRMVVKLEEQDGGEKEVIHHRFEGWPDYGVPSSMNQIQEFVATSIGNIDEGADSSPVLVHCLGGVGRTGTVVLADVLTRMVKQSGSPEVDINEVLVGLRRQRMWMVQTPEQLELAMRMAAKGSGLK